MIPAFLKPNSEIRIISPSGAINPENIVGAAKALAHWGLKVTEGKFARTVHGRFAGTTEQRISDLQDAIDDVEVSAILCSRGGYGVVQLIDKIDFSPLKKNPKWLVGFSDITLLHSAFSNLQVASIHGIMAKHLTELLSTDDSVVFLKEILFGKLPNYTIPPHALNRKGEANAKIVGGNLSVLTAAIGSKFDLPYDGNILFLEEIDEKPYHIDRMLHNLRLCNVFKRISGLIVGQFRYCEEDSEMCHTIYEGIRSMAAEGNYPVCFNFPAGHVDCNLPIVLGQQARLQVGEQVHVSY